jgi:serine/threonine protein kinase
MIIANKYEIIEKLNEGQFGLIVKGKNITTGEYVAIKIADNLKMEAKIYQYLGNLDGFPRLKWYGTIGEKKYLVLELLKYSLLDIIKLNGKLKLTKVLNIGIQMIKRIELLHSKYLIHRDIKPANFMIKDNKIYLIDFGMCKRYKKDGIHMKCNKLTNIIGSLNFVSLNVHNGIEPSRRDDIESIIYVLLFLLYGTLDWYEEKSISNVILYKSKLTKEEIIPNIIKQMLFYVYQLKFEDKPNYNYLYNMLQNSL